MDALRVAVNAYIMGDMPAAHAAWGGAAAGACWEVPGFSVRVTCCSGRCLRSCAACRGCPGPRYYRRLPWWQAS